MPRSISEVQSRRDTPFIRVPRDHRKDFREFMQTQMALPETDVRWKGMCESLQRQAHNKPAKFASAYAHMIATPLKERMDPLEAPRTAFIFVDDPRDANAFGHVVGKWDMGPGSLNDIPVVTNDVSDTKAGYDPGNVTVCKLGWFPSNWGDSIQFATLWFGGDDVPTVDPQTPAEDTEKWVQAAIDNCEDTIELMQKALRDVRPTSSAAAARHARAIHREIADQRQNIRDLKQLLPD